MKKKKTNRKRKTILMDVAKASGFNDEKSFLEHIIKKYGSRLAAAEAVNITYDWINKCCQRVGIESPKSKQAIRRKIRELNEKYQTNYTRTSEIASYLASLGKSHKQIADELEVSTKTIYNVLGSEGLYKPREESVKILFSDCRPSNIQGPWTDPTRSPCSECEHAGRDKNEPGCVKCNLRLQYIALSGCGLLTNACIEPAPYSGYGANMGWNQVY